MDDGDTCSICFDVFTLPKILHCGHTFCFQCLHEYFDEIKSRQGELKCPLCRAKCTIPEKGLEHFVTNYFISVPNHDQSCNKCKISSVSKFCHACFLYMCTKCFKSHIHSLSTNKSVDAKNDASDDEDDIRQRMRLPLSMIFVQDARSMYICRVDTQFVVEIPSDSGGRHPIFSLCLSRTGGIFAVPCGVPYIFIFDKNGQQIERIKTPYQCYNVQELENECLLGVFSLNKLILKYVHGGWSYFAQCPDFFPIGMTELSKGNIAVCGPDQMTTDINEKRTGHLQIFSPNGNPTMVLHKITGNTKVFSYPHKMACNKNKGIIAVADQENNNVTVLQENGVILQTYTGATGMIVPHLPLFGMQNQIHFHPVGISCSPCGYFLVSTADGCLHILGHSGKLLGIALSECEDRFGRIPDVIQDNNGILWSSDSSNGTIKTFKIVNIQNNFNNNENYSIQLNVSAPRMF